MVSSYTSKVKNTYKGNNTSVPTHEGTVGSRQGKVIIYHQKLKAKWRGFSIFIVRIKMESLKYRRQGLIVRIIQIKKLKEKFGTNWQ